MPRLTRAVVKTGAVAKGVPAAIVEMLLDLGINETELTLDSTPEDLQFDEIDLVEFVMACEDAFKIELPDRVLDTWPTTTVAKIIETVRTLGAKV
jgi:acyl carrier protein